MKRWSRLISTILVVVMLAGILAACGTKQETVQSDKPKEQTGSSGNINLTGLPIVKEPITLKFMAGQSPLHGEWKDKLLWKEAEKRTGIHVEWVLIPSANLNEKKNIMLASGDLPDGFYGGGISQTDLVTYGQQGVFLPLNDLINKYAPNFKAVMSKDAQVKKGITTPDGKIYTLPKMSTNITHRIGSKLFINQKWLGAVGMKAPTTTDELYAVLKAFKEKDPNGNGVKDEVPLTHTLGSVLNSMYGAWGLCNRGIGHTLVDVDESTGKLRFIPIDPKYKSMLEYINKLYTEGLLDQRVFTNNTQQLTADAEKDIVGAFGNINTVPVGAKGKDFTGIPTALKGPSGDQLWSGVSPTVQTPGAFVLTNKNKYPEASIRWADYFIDGEGAVLYWMGVEGVTYEMKDGKYRFVKDITNNQNGLKLDEAISRELVAPFTNHPIVREERFAWDTGEGLPEVIDAAKKLQSYLPKEVWGPFYYTKEENDRVVALSNDIKTYVNEMQAQFITGKASFTEWDKYVQTIKKMGLDEYMKLYETSYERYKKN